MLLLILTVIFLSSCTPTVRQSLMPKKNNVEVVKQGIFGFSEEEERFIEQEARTFNINIPDRQEIIRFVNYFLTNKQEFERMMQRANYYIPIIKPIIKKYGLPEELALLPAIESGFNPFAVSRAGAAGLWQFIPSTGRRYGLRIDQDVDERFDIIKSTESAALYLKDLYEMFKSWELALAAYNCGENCIKRRTGGADFWLTQNLLPIETRNYVPAFFAVLLLARYPEKYGLNVSIQGLNLAVNKVEEDTTVEEVIKNISLKESIFRDLNPHIRGERIPSGVNIYVPKDHALFSENVIRLENGAKLIFR